MISMQPVTRWFGAAALVVSSLALWRSESRAPTTEPVHVPTPIAAVTVSPLIPTTPLIADAAPSRIAVVEPPTRVAPSMPRDSLSPTPTHARFTSDASPLRVRRLVVTRDIENREPVASGESFSLGDPGRIGAFLEIENTSGEQVPVFVRFERPGGGTSVGHVELAVPAQHRWRTWGFTRMIRTPGAWVAVITTATGHELARTAFEVTA